MCTNAAVPVLKVHDKRLVLRGLGTQMGQWISKKKLEITEIHTFNYGRLTDFNCTVVTPQYMLIQTGNHQILK